ncbi:MAG: L-seryl-tRNA(Sec) selenium transferase, partial [Oscillospiraceae bacterium]|nr:L-seryl-tRNA(Sec) selenium transferase [Oscillospiraceae bacterium]
SGVEAEVITEVSQVGGGSVPTQVLPTYAVAILGDKLSPNELEKALRLWEKPIIVRIVRDRCILDARTLMEEDFACIVQALTEILA